MARTEAAAIAAALLCASGQLEWERMDRFALAGELALDGQVRPINGALAITEAARDYHERMFPGYVSDFIRTDPEFIERSTTSPSTR